MTRRLLLLLGVLLLPLIGLVVPVQAGELVPVVNTAPPSISGTPVYRGLLAASPGTWDPADSTYTYRWLRDGTPISGATAPTYHPVLLDIGKRLSVQVTASHPDHAPATATSAETAPVRRATLTLVERPVISGKRRYLHTLTASKGQWAQWIDRYSFRWLRDGTPIKGATGQRHKLGLKDFGHRISVRVVARKPGYIARAATSYPTRRIDHRVPLRHTVYYHVETRGRITASLADFRRLANATLNDPRGWRSTGIAFREVRSGGSMTLVLAEASRVPGFSSVCSSSWSCRVGRYVIINQTRWQNASPAWWLHHGSLRGYRHLVVNHETGHWLGHGHRGCPAAGALAPVMQQQSKALGGCRINPWPTKREWYTPRFS
jgi:hypothetical protein